MAKEIRSNIPRVKVNDMVDMFAPLIVKCRTGRDFPAVNLSGPPGVGKSDGIRALANRVAKETGKEVIVHDVRLLNMNPVDLRGIPSKDEKQCVVIENGVEKTQRVAVARWLRPEIFQMDEARNIINFLFLDEITAAPQSVQAAAYQLVLDRKVGEHKLPDNCFVFTAGNRITDKSVAYKMPKALANRMCHMEIYADADDWKRWALNKGIDQRIVSYISRFNNRLFDFEPNNDDLAYPTPRSWAMADSYLQMGIDIESPIGFSFISGCIGMAQANEFKMHTKLFDKIPNVKDIFDGKEVPAIKEPDVSYALSAAIVAFAAKQTTTKDQLNNLLKFICEDKMGAEFSTMTVKDIILLDHVKMIIMKLPEFVAFSKKFKKLIM